MSSYANLDDYSFDLGKLEESSNLPIPSRTRKVESINSRDDGPEDFTLNLEKWMRGTGPYKQGEGPPEDDEEAKHEADEESAFTEPQDSSTPSPVRTQKTTNTEVAATPIRPRKATVEDAADVDSPLRLPTPKLSRLNTEAKQERAAEEVFDRISALQAEVERLRDENEKRLSASKRLEDDKVQMQADNQKLSARLQDTNATILELRAKNVEQSTASKLKDEEYAHLQTNNQKLHSRLKDTEGEVQELRTESQEQLAANKKLQEDVAHMQSDNQKLYDRLQDTVATVKNLEHRIEAESAAKQGFQDEIEQCQEAIEDLEADKRQLEADKQGIECHRCVNPNL